MILGIGPSICSPQVIVLVEQQQQQQQALKVAWKVMPMDVGHRLLCSLRQVDSRCRNLSCNPHRTLLFSAHFNIHSLNMDIYSNSRHCWHGSHRIISDDKLANILGEIFRFGAALSSQRSWSLGSGQVTVRCMSHRSMVLASTETRDAEDVSKNDQLIVSQTYEIQQGIFETRNFGESNLLVEHDGDQLELSDVNVLQEGDSSIEEDSLNSIVNGGDVPTKDFNDVSESRTEPLTDAVVIVFDIETTGFRLSDDRIIEFAARDLAGGECSTMQTLVNPERPVPIYASNVHGIYSSMVNKSDVPRWREVAPVLTQFVERRRISGAPVFLVAHNGKRFDVPFLMKEFERCSLQIPSWWQFVDSVPIAREVMKAKGGKCPLRLSALYEHYKLPHLGKAHRALADVDMLANVLQMLLIDLKMSFSEFLKKSFTAKDIVRSSTRSSNNLESLPQDVEVIDELSMEDEDLAEVSPAVCKNLDVPWDNPNLDREIWTNPNTEKNEMTISGHGSSTVNSACQISTNPDVVYRSKNANCFLELDDTDLCQLSPVLKEYLLTKLKRPDLLLLWKAGEFYQAFFSDAKRLSEMCNVALCAIWGNEVIQNEMGEHLISVKKHAVTNIILPDDYKEIPCDAPEDAACFVTTSLIEHSKKRAGLIRKLKYTETVILKDLRNELCSFIKPLQIASQAIAAVDVLASFAEVAVLRQYGKPAVIEGNREIRVIGGRHPVAERLKTNEEPFSANSLYMGHQPDRDENSLPKAAWDIDLNEANSCPSEQNWPFPDVLILTGPPASGKSCYLCQAGLIQLLAQIGSYVPAKRAVLGIADAIFMKAEEFDDVSTGKSSFELDMTMWANILRSVTSQSLVLLDEGAVTRAFVEFLAQNVKARTLLTTQNNLGTLEEELRNVANFQCINNNDLMLSYCVRAGYYYEPSISVLDKIDGLPKWISTRAAQLMSKNDITIEEVCHLEQQLSSSNITREDAHHLEDQPRSLDVEGDHHETCLPRIDGSEVQSFELEQDASAGEFELFEQSTLPDYSLQEGSFKVRPESDSLPEYPHSGTELELQVCSSDNCSEIAATIPALSASFEGVSETVQIPKNTQEQELINRDSLEEAWQLVLQALEDSPATRALAKQQGILVSMKRSLEIWEVQMSTSALFLKKFLQQEHATALENAFLTVLKSPIQLNFTVASKHN